MQTVKGIIHKEVLYAHKLHIQHAHTYTTCIASNARKRQLVSGEREQLKFIQINILATMQASTLTHWHAACSSEWNPTMSCTHVCM